MEENHWCFQLERFDERQARFGMYREYLGEVTSSPFSGSTISAKRGYWLDHKNGDMIAEYTDYSLTSFPHFKPSSFQTPMHCNSFIDQLGPRGLDIHDVLRPLSDR
jgi:hypothetical protein